MTFTVTTRPPVPAVMRGVGVFPGEGDLPDPVPDGILDGDLWLDLTTSTFTVVAIA